MLTIFKSYTSIYSRWSKSILGMSQAILIASCASIGTSVINIDYKPQEDKASALASVSPVKVRIGGFRDERGTGEPIFLGRKFAAMEVPMGDVTTEQPVFALVANSISAEFIAAGHNVVRDGEDLIITGSIKKLSAGTPTVTMTYWVVSSEVSIVIEVKSPKSGKILLTRNYEGKASVKEYGSPSDELLTTQLNKALSDAMQALRNDTALAKILSEATTG